MRIHAFQAFRPPADLVEEVASPPYDVMNASEAREMAGDNAKSFLHVIRPEIDLPEGQSVYDDQVYAKARENLDAFVAQGWLVKDETPSFYLYRQIMDGHSQTGLVACCHAEDYENDLILKHENTLQSKEDDRTRHVDTLDANTGPVFLAYKDEETIASLTATQMEEAPLYDFTGADGVRHTVWTCPQTEAWLNAFSPVEKFYVADGHHRSASAARVGKMRREANSHHTGSEEYNWFLSVLFPAGDLKILAYNRAVSGLNGHSPAELLGAVSSIMHCVETDQPVPSAPGLTCMYLDGSWYELSWEIPGEDPVEALDVSVLQNRILNPLLDIDDPRTNNRIQFIGGIRGTEELEKKVNSGAADVAFSLYPTSMQQLMDVAAAGRIMPPKSTWFEPKLKSGLFVHALSE
jgi:uncharacterized protein (DUF1015 family)